MAPPLTLAAVAAASGVQDNLCRGGFISSSLSYPANVYTHTHAQVVGWNSPRLWAQGLEGASLFFIFKILFREREEGREKEKKRNIDVLEKP